MADGRSRGLVFFALIAVVAGLGGVGIWQLYERAGPPEDAQVGEGAGSSLLVKGTGTSWREDDGSDQSGALEGVVLDADGSPVDGATVTLGRPPARGEDGFGMSVRQPKGSATSAGRGRFRIEKLTPGQYSATAIREGSGPGQRTQIQIAAGETARVEIKLARTGLVLSGRVLDVGGGAIGGAHITALIRGASPGGAPLLFLARSNDEGQYRMTLAKGWHFLRAEAEGYAPHNDTDLLLVRSMIRDLRLVPAARVAGRVIERGSRRPLAEAEVSLTSASRMDFRQPRDGKTDGNGRFEFTDLEPGSYEVMARKGMLIGAGQTVDLAVAQSVTDLEVEVDRGHVVSGRVKDERGVGLPGISISGSRDTPPFGQAVRTRSNPDGSYALEGLLPGSYRLQAFEEGYGLAHAPARVIRNDLANVDLVLPTAIRVSGKVVTASGKPVEGVQVRATIETRTAGGMTMRGDVAGSGPDGTFELKRVGPGTVRLTAHSDDHGTATVGPEEVKAGEPKVLTVVLRKGSSVSGTVKTQDGRPAADVRVAANVRATSTMMAGGVQDLTGPDGRYRLQNLIAGRVTVTAVRASGSEPDFGVDRPDQKSFVIGETEDRTDVDLVVPPAGLALKGTVTAPDGKPVPGAVITAGVERFGRAFRGGSREMRAFSQHDGQFALDDMGEGPYTLWATHPDHPEGELKGQAGGTSGVKLQFPPDTSVAGLVVAPDGTPIPHYAITVIPGPKPDENPEDRRHRQMDTFEARSQRVQSPTGSFEVRRLAAGTHELQVSAAGGETATQVVTLRAGERRTGVRIQLQPSVRVTGRVLEHGSGKAIPGSTVRVRGKGNHEAEAEASADGSFVIEGAPVSETLQLFAHADDTRFVSERKDLEVKPNQTTIDAGTIKLLPGNARDRWGDMAERGEHGASIGLESGQPTLRNVRPDSPADRAGLKTGELVTSINGISTSELGNGALDYLASGRPGTTVTLVVETPGEGAPRTVVVTLAPSKPPPPRSN